MKKNRAMRIAALLLVLTMMTSCFVGGTFAKYTSAGDTGEQTARVAKWGVTVVADGTDTFGEYYKSVANGNTINTSYTVGTDTVKSANGDNVVAPGTNGTVTGLTISGTPEVKTKVTFSAVVSLENWTVNGGYYCPLVVTVTANNGTPVVIKGTDCTDMDDFEQKIATEIAKATANFEAGAAINDDALSVSWEWPFETGADEAAKAANNLKDTALGDAAAATVTINITCTVDQVD